MVFMNWETEADVQACHNCDRNYGQTLGLGK